MTMHTLSRRRIATRASCRQGSLNHSLSLSRTSVLLLVVPVVPGKCCANDSPLLPRRWCSCCCRSSRRPCCCCVTHGLRWLCMCCMLLLINDIVHDLDWIDNIELWCRTCPCPLQPRVRQSFAHPASWKGQECTVRYQMMLMFMLIHDFVTVSVVVDSC